MTGQTAVVTGAGTGIGQATAQLLAAQGMRVLAVGRTAARLEATAAGHHGIVPLVADISREEDVARIGEAAGTPPLRAWVNCAAVVEPTAFADLDAARWDAVLDVNLRGTYLCCRAAFTRMAEHGGGGAILNIASLSGVPNVEKFPGLSAYNVSKAGVIALTEAIALEGRAQGVRCISLSPGAVDTEMLRRAAPHLKPGVTPADVAAIIAFLLSEAAAPLTGVNIPIFSNA